MNISKSEEETGQKQKLRVLTLLILQFNHLIDTGKYRGITIEDIRIQIKDNNIIEYLRKETEKDDADFSPFTADGPYSEYLSYYYEQMQVIHDAYGGAENKWGVKNSGLCLLVAWTNEIIQQGSGWHPLE